MTISVERIDHFVITASDVGATMCFYERVLGMETVPFGSGRKALHFENQQINIHHAGNEAKPTALNAQPGTAQEHLTTEKVAPYMGQ
ncbi:MAG: Virulence protein [Alphaproteobacteria bacterium MarineAlpha9_Bin5]|nr:MAG: Virulence protein [Alphaproteobacteria bacterium MarineAlpha9_Bin5]